MDELSLFFSVPSNGGLRTHSTYNSSCNLKDIDIDKIDLRRNFSVPILSDADTFGLSPPNTLSSTCLKESSDLPLSLPPEVEEGNIEYKLKLVHPSQNRFEHLITQMKWRLNEGRGQAIYRLGVDDNGVVTGLTASEMAASLLTISRMSYLLGTSLTLLRECTVAGESLNSNKCVRKAVELLVKKNLPVNFGLPDLYVTVLGSVDVGKSTLLGILTYGELDNGRGRARLNLFRHLHEVQSGRTSSLSSEVIGFDVSGRLVNRKRSKGRINRRTVDEVVRDSHRLVTLLDLAGHPKYQRTTLYGLARSYPSFAVLVVSATGGGPTPEGLDHARTVAALGLRLAVVVSKTDLLQQECGEEAEKINIDTVKVLSDTRFNTDHLYKSSSMATILKPNIVSTRCSTKDSIAEIKNNIQAKLEEIKCYSLDHNGQISSQRCFEKDLPIFALSSVNGSGLNELLIFLAKISSANSSESLSDTYLSRNTPITSLQPSFSMSNNTRSCNNDQIVEFWITRVFWQVPGASNPVLEGILRSGKLHDNQDLWLGPCKDGKFVPVQVIEIHHNRQPHYTLLPGQTGSVVLGNAYNRNIDGSDPTNAEVGKNDDPEYGENNPVQNSLHVRRGMVLINHTRSLSSDHPSDTIEFSKNTAVCWSIVVSDIIWVPSSSGWSKSSRCYPSKNSSVTVFSGNVLQQAKVIETTIDSDLVASFSQSVYDVDTSLLCLDPKNCKLILRFLRQPEYLNRGRLCILSFDSGGKAVGYICELLEVMISTSDSQTNSPKIVVDPTLRPCDSCSTPMKPNLVESEPSCLEELLRKLGIDQNGTYSYDISPDEALSPDDIQRLACLVPFSRGDMRNSKRMNRMRAIVDQNCTRGNKGEMKIGFEIAASKEGVTLVNNRNTVDSYTSSRHSMLRSESTILSPYMRYVSNKLNGFRHSSFDMEMDKCLEKAVTLDIAVDQPQHKVTVPESSTVKKVRKRRRRRRRHRK